jgi:tetratricopeptide (TPR) repeat protein
MAHHQQGDAKTARTLYDEFLEAAPDHPQALRLAGALARDAGELARSRELLDRACTAAPDEAEPFNERALTCLAAGDLPQAESALRDALARDEDSVRAWANLGALFQYRGRLHAAADCHREVLARQPDDLEVRCNLAYTLLDAGRSDEALLECNAALERAPGHPFVLAAKGAILVATERAGEAVECLQRATGRYPEDDMAWTNLGLAWRALEEPQAARRALEQAAQRNPDNARAVADLVNLCSALGDDQRALSLSEEFLARHPGERLVVASHAIALRDAGQAEAADALVDLQGMIQVSEPPLPDGFGDRDAFLGELTRVILQDESLLAEPASKATRGGLQTGELDLDQAPSLAALGRMFLEAVQAASHGLRDAFGPDHACCAYDTGRWQLRAWGTVLETGGTQAPHQHPVGHLSGVYYLQVPDMGAAGSNAGWLEFGQPPPRVVCRSAAPRRSVPPKPGQLVLFPSYFWHRTIPFESAETRVSIAFDAVPVAAKLV